MLHALLVPSTLSLFACGAPSAAREAAPQARRIELVEAYRAARKAEDFEGARTYLAADPRVWFDEKQGEGMPLTLGIGRWKAWDDEFRSAGEPGPWQAEGERVFAVVEEWNDYFRLLERSDTPRYLMTYFFDAEDRITGQMISSVPGGDPTQENQSRFEEFRAWAQAGHAAEWDYLRPGDKLDPTGDRARRTRALLDAWRAER